MEATGASFVAQGSWTAAAGEVGDAGRAGGFGGFAESAGIGWLACTRVCFGVIGAALEAGG